MGSSRYSSYDNRRRQKKNSTSAWNLLLLLLALLFAGYIGSSSGAEYTELMNRTGEAGSARVMASLNAEPELQADGATTESPLEDQLLWRAIPAAIPQPEPQVHSYQHVPSLDDSFRLSSVDITSAPLADGERIDIRLGARERGFYVLRTYNHRVSELYELPSGQKKLLAEHNLHEEISAARLRLSTKPKGAQLEIGDSVIPVFQQFSLDNSSVELALLLPPEKITELSIAADTDL